MNGDRTCVRVANILENLCISTNNIHLTQVRPPLNLQVQLTCKFSSTCKINLVFKIDESTAIVIVIIITITIAVE